MKIHTPGPDALFIAGKNSYSLYGAGLQKSLYRMVFDQMTDAGPLHPNMRRVWDYITQARAGHGSGLRHTPFGHNGDAFGADYRAQHFIGERLCNWANSKIIEVSRDDGSRREERSVYDLLRLSFCLAQLQGWHTGTDACYRATQCGDWSDDAILGAYDIIVGTCRKYAYEGYLFAPNGGAGKDDPRDEYVITGRQAALDFYDALEGVLDIIPMSEIDRETLRKDLQSIFGSEMAEAINSIFMPDAMEHVLRKTGRDGVKTRMQFNWMGFDLEVAPTRGSSRPTWTCDDQSWDDLEDMFTDLRRQLDLQRCDAAMLGSGELHLLVK